MSRNANDVDEDDDDNDGETEKKHTKQQKLYRILLNRSLVFSGKMWYLPLPSFCLLFSFSFLDFNVQYTLDAKKSKEPRMFFLNHEGRNVLNETVRLNKRKQLCSSQQVYLRVSLSSGLKSTKQVEIFYFVMLSNTDANFYVPIEIDIQYCIYNMSNIQQPLFQISCSLFVLSIPWLDTGIESGWFRENSSMIACLKRD